MSEKVYKIVTDRIIDGLEKGEIPWHKEWSGGLAGMPRNGESKRAYRGINVWLLAFTPYTSPDFYTFKQVKKMGGYVRKGEKGWLVTFFKMHDFKDKETGEISATVPLLRYYTVFNAEQCEGIPIKDKPKPVIDFKPIERAQRIVDGMPKRPPIEHNEQRAFYRPGTDSVNMPKPETFTSENAYYGTLYHELVHSTGHENRLDRHRHEKSTHMFSSESYSKEELTAEMGAAFLCNIAEIETPELRENQQAYINGWLKRLKSDPKFVVKAASKAQAACDFILNKDGKHKVENPWSMPDHWSL